MFSGDWPSAIWCVVGALIALVAFGLIGDGRANVSGFFLLWAGSFAFLIALAVTFILRLSLNFACTRLKPHRRTIAACVTGTLLWVFLVWTYAMVTGGLRDEGRFWSAVILPPIGALLTVAWVRTFIRNRPR